MKTFTKIVRPGTSKTYNGRSYSVFCRIEYKPDGDLSITGVEGPLPSGNCLGSCGQITEELNEITSYSPGWSRELVEYFQAVWRTFHLNNLQSACEHQRIMGWEYEDHPGSPCPVCGYRLGYGWLRMEVPDHVILWLKNLPDTDITPAWA